MSFGLPAAAQDASGPILFTNVNVFDGVNEALIENANVVVTDNLIADPHKNFVVIMKDGKILKNTLN